ncbi:MAG: glycosyltransferase family 2 protein, partial [Bacillota bacterium]
MNVSVLIPAFNEEQQIKETIDTLYKIKAVKEILVIDDASTDSTYQQALKTKAEVFTLPYNQGKGAALNYGLKKVKEDIILLIDADLGESALEAQKLLYPIFNGQAEMTIAQFS